MSVEDFEKAYYGKNYDKVMNEAKKDHEKLKADFLKKYPHPYISKFEFDVYYNQDGTVESTAIYFKNSDVISTDIKSSTFLNDRSMTKYLHSNNGHNLSLNDRSMTKHHDSNKNPKNIKHRVFPKIWRSDGTV